MVKNITDATLGFLTQSNVRSVTLYDDYNFFRFTLSSSLLYQNHKVYEISRYDNRETSLLSTRTVHMGSSHSTFSSNHADNL